MRWVGKEKQAKRSNYGDPARSGHGRGDRCEKQTPNDLTTGWMERTVSWVILRFHICEDDCEIYCNRKEGGGCQIWWD